MRKNGYTSDTKRQKINTFRGQRNVTGQNSPPPKLPKGLSQEKIDVRVSLKGRLTHPFCNEECPMDVWRVVLNASFVTKNIDFHAHKTVQESLYSLTVGMVYVT